MFLAITFDAYLLVKKTDYCDRCSSEFKLILEFKCRSWQNIEDMFTLKPEPWTI